MITWTKQSRRAFWSGALNPQGSYYQRFSFGISRHLAAGHQPSVDLARFYRGRARVTGQAIPEDRKRHMAFTLTTSVAPNKAGTTITVGTYATLAEAQAAAEQFQPEVQI